MTVRDIDMHTHIIPGAYAVVWGVGLAVGLYDLLPQAVTPIGRMLTVALSVYSVFLLESLISIIDMGLDYDDWDFVRTPSCLMALQVGVVIAVVFIAGLLYVLSDTLSFWILVILMSSHKLFMSSLENSHGRNLPDDYVNTLDL